jgi:hypothetical protein
MQGLIVLHEGMHKEGVNDALRDLIEGLLGKTETVRGRLVGKDGGRRFQM